MISDRIYTSGTSVLPMDGNISPLTPDLTRWAGQASHVEETLLLVAPSSRHPEAALLRDGYIPTNRFVIVERREVRLYAAPVPLAA